MTCKDCLHFKACYEMAAAFGTEEFNILYANKCEDFANRSEWMHLPCDVGDIVYLLFNGKCGEYRITQMSIDAAGNLQIRADCNMHGYRKMRDCAREYCGKAICTVGLGESAFGSIAFLTREEAEKALETSKG